MKVLVIDDNISLSELIKEFLELKNYDVDIANDGEVAKEMINSNKYDLFIVDIHLPNTNGLELIKFIRGKSLEVPIVMITSSDEIDDFMTAFGNGANEFIRKPFYFEELEVRINKLFNKAIQNLVKINDKVSFDILNKNLYINGEIAKLRKKEQRFLELLAKNINNVVHTENIINYVWENKPKDNYPIRQLVSALKHRYPELKEHIEVLHKTGYMLKNK
jgi:DNA-binding response OmpR family regulator